MKLNKLAGATSEIWQVFVQDSSSSTGAGLTGLAFNTAGLTAYYHRDTDTTATAISLVTMTVGTFTSSGFKEIDATNMPGWYQFCPPNAAIAASAKSCGFHLKGATNMAPLPIEVQLSSYDPDNATSLGLSRIDAAVTSRMATYTQPTGFLAATFPSGTVANTTNITTAVGITVSTNSDKTGYSLSQTFPANFSSLAITAGGAMTVGTNSDKTGYTVSTVSDKTGYALTAAYDAAKTAATQTSADAIKAKTDSLTFTVAGQVDSNVQFVNDTLVNGNGSPGTPWGP